MPPMDEFTTFPHRHEFLVGIDSDGCAFDTMELKHKECFIPAIIRHFELQPVATYARQAAEFVNLYSRWRGINRFPALLKTMELLAARPEVAERQAHVPRLDALRAWLEHEPKPSEPALVAALDGAHGPAAAELRRVLAWSRAVNTSIAETVRAVPPFPFVRAAVARAALRADIIVVSATPGEALRREWSEHGLAEFVALIAGQELGRKADHLRLAAGGRYAAGHVLMIGDAPGDMDAARAVGALFFPVNPGREVASWRRLHDEALDCFFAGNYAGDYEARLSAEFATLLPERPPWETAPA